jgi:hypothetical protein
MTTLCRRAFVSIAAISTMTLALGACASAPSRAVADKPFSLGTRPLTLRFENLARDNVDVYLIGEKREWLLGRVATGEIASLRLPDEALAEGTMLRLAVLAGERLTLAAARNPRAVLTTAQPLAVMLSQRWAFSRGSLTSLQHSQ